jgi:NAD(P)-dependent dehydrogenase (short-subunit alcohol dehydrogenase family)
VDRDTERMQETVRAVAEAGGVLATGAMRRDAVGLHRGGGGGLHRPLRPHRRAGQQRGRLGQGRPVEMAEETWDAQLDHNLKSVFLTCKHVLPHMEAQAAGAIVNIASTSGLRWTGSAQIAYASTKAGVMQFSRVLAVQYAKAGIRVNTVVPGQLYTPMVDVRLAKQRTGGDVTALLQQRQSRIPLPFMGDGRDTANAALFLASDEARFITGTEIVVDGGMSVRCD